MWYKKLEYGKCIHLKLVIPACDLDWLLTTKTGNRTQGKEENATIK